nr:Chain C, Marker peptide [Homo sapiens]5C0B_H Chain H, Marker peptide [Homo sapiens]5C0I_C Chain C, Marker peptide [Homo sapiens]
RQFGPDFPTI